MDSMRSLNTSLPRTSPQRRAQQSQQQNQQQPEDLLSAFKAAALSVTNLYKSAAASQAPVKGVKSAGYQEALDDLLDFLDRQNIGLDDGEGWRIRQWATERLDGSHVGGHHDSEDEEDEAGEEEVVENLPVETENKEAVREEDLSSSVELPPAKEIESKPGTSRQTEQRQSSPFGNMGNNAFTFRSSHNFPTNHDRDVSMDGAVGGNEPRAPTQSNSSSNNSNARHDTSSPRHTRTRQQRPSNQRSGNSSRNGLGSGAGSKRRFPLGDFFDLSGINFDTTKDGSDRGGKRSRHV
jgi:hypothetical protein